MKHNIIEVNFNNLQILIIILVHFYICILWLFRFNLKTCIVNHEL